VRLGYDLSILRHPIGGTGRYARELFNAMAASPSRGEDELIAEGGWARFRRANGMLRVPRRVANVIGDAGWLSVGRSWRGARDRLDAWFGPANVLPLTLPRPSVVTIHDLNFLLHPETYDRVYARYARWTYGAAVGRARTVLTDSETSRRLIVELLGAAPERTVVVYPGVDHLPDPEVSGASDSPATAFPMPPRPYALYVGQTEPHKNVGLLLDAWRLGVPPELHLVICGWPGRDDERLRDLAAGADLRQRVHFVTVSNDVELARIYRGARMFLFPSLSEGFGFPPLEAMRFEVPTAVSTAGSLPEVTALGAIQFDPDDPQGLAAIVGRLQDDDDLRSRLEVEGRSVAARYRWSRAAAAVWQEVRNAVSS
jgi:glycosyltransferase involved in cell wall biosynthesis